MLDKTIVPVSPDLIDTTEGQADGRPQWHFRYNTSRASRDYYYVLREDIHEWCNALGYSYDIGLLNNWYIAFDDANQAMLFKLTWVGQ